jgi:inositol phosphorylceramide mannosyltransferase catalytic subunit
MGSIMKAKSIIFKSLSFFFLFLIGFFCFCATKKNPVLPAPFISFNECMRKKDPKFGKTPFKYKKTKQQWKLLKELYNKHLSAPPSLQPRIPKIIHQIWLGGELPQKYYHLQKSWQQHHPDWEYRLWTDADLADFHFTHRQRFEKAVNKGEQSDILRYEILYQFGGLYVDTDFECIKPHDPLHHHCDFYIGLEVKMPGEHRPFMGNALIGSVAGHPILKHCLDGISKTEACGNNADLIQKTTGPQCLSSAFLKLCNQGEFRNVAFPFTYFYPLPAVDRKNALPKEKWLHEESFGIHYWYVSWHDGY